MISYYAVAKWHSLGIQLGFQPGRLKSIEKGCQHRPVRDSCKDMLEDWKEGQADERIAITKLITAVEKINNNYAYELKSKYCIITPNEF